MIDFKVFVRSEGTLDRLGAVHLSHKANCGCRDHKSVFVSQPILRTKHPPFLSLTACAPPKKLSKNIKAIWRVKGIAMATNPNSALWD